MEAPTEKIEFPRARTLAFIGVLSAAIAVFGSSPGHPALRYASMALLAVFTINYVWDRRNPLIVLGVSEMVIRPAFLSRSHRIAYPEVAGWNHSDEWVVFETIRSERVLVPLRLLKRPDRTRLLERLRVMNLGQPGLPSISQREVDRRNFRIRAIALAAVVVAVPVSYWMVFHYGVTSPDEYYMSLTRCGEVALDTDPALQCFAAPEVRAYIDESERRVLDVWRLPAGVAADQHVDVVFRLDPDGSFRCLSLSNEWEEALARSVISAFERSAPFDPLPPEAACLAEVPITARFANPKSGE